MWYQWNHKCPINDTTLLPPDNVRVVEVGLAGFLYQLPIWFPDLVVQGFHKNDNFMVHKYTFTMFSIGSNFHNKEHFPWAEGRETVEAGVD